MILLLGALSLGVAARSEAATSVEERCLELGANCKCSEPMDANEGTISAGRDFVGSGDAKECWGRGSGFQSFGSNGTQSSKPVSWTPGGYAVRQAAGAGFIWLSGENTASGAQAFTSADKVQCYRYYKQVDPLYGGAGNYSGPCTGTTWRNKMMQMSWANQLVQFSEKSNGSCPVLGSFNPFNIEVLNGPRSGNYSPPSTLTFANCVNGPCRIEFCVDSTYLASGDNAEYRGRVCSADGTCVSASTGILGDLGAPNLPDTWGGDVFHSSPYGGSWIGFFMSARWQVDSNQWIGPASEIESTGTGGSSPNPPPPAPVLLP